MGMRNYLPQEIFAVAPERNKEVKLIKKIGDECVSA